MSNIPAGSVLMSEDELSAAQARTSAAVELARQEREAAARSLSDRIERGEVVPEPEVQLDRRRPPPGDPGVMTREEFDEELESRANLDIIMGLREVEGAELVRWQISRLSDPTGRKPTGYLCEWGTDILSTHRIQEEFGAGTYKVVGKHSNGRFAGQRTVKIAEDSKSIPIPAHVPQSETSQGSSSMQDLMVMLSQQNEQRRQEESDRRREDNERRDRERADRMQLAQIFAPVVASVVPALFAPRGGGVTELVQGLAAMRALDPPPPAPAAGPNPIETALKLFDKFTDMAPKGAGETGWADVLKEIVRSVGPGLAPLAAQLASMRPPPRQPQAQLPAPSVPTAGPPDLYGGTLPPSASQASPLSSAGDAPTGSNVIPFPQVAVGDPNPTEGDDVNVFQMVKLVPWLKGQVDTLLQKAARDSNPSLYAEVVLDSIPENINGDVLLEFLKRPDWLAVLTQFDSRVAQYAPWFTALRGEIISQGEAIKAELAQAKPTTTTATATQSAPPQVDEIDRPKGPPGLGV